MIIHSKNKYYFALQEGDNSILINPDNQKSFKGTDIIINTKMPALTSKPETRPPLWIEHQGEYESKQIKIKGWSINTKNNYQTAYFIKWDDYKIMVFDSLTDELSPDLTSNLEKANIIILTSDDNNIKILKNSMPKFIIINEQNKILPSLLNLFGIKNIEKINKFTLKKSNLSLNNIQVICLTS
ncbi:MAG: hypothetical protein ACP5IC_00490 [Minisyncoccia bacterium]